MLLTKYSRLYLEAPIPLGLRIIICKLLIYDKKFSISPLYNTNHYISPEILPVAYLISNTDKNITFYVISKENIHIFMSSEKDSLITYNIPIDIQTFFNFFNI